MVVEGVGGLLVPLTRDYLVRDLAVDARPSARRRRRPGLGTINHTLLTLAAARAAGLRVAVRADTLAGAQIRWRTTQTRRATAGQV